MNANKSLLTPNVLGVTAVRRSPYTSAASSSCGRLILNIGWADTHTERTEMTSAPCSSARTAARPRPLLTLELAAPPAESFAL